ncbi:MAG: hypothetical protein GY898_21460 [Proteobacteria bacterium]|nr:hypothetical protein [Pseudomonadota bacterium]
MPALVVVLPLLVLTLLVRWAAMPPAPPEPAEPPPPLLEVLVTETGWRLRVTDTRTGWPEPQRADGLAELLEGRTTYVYRGFDGDGPLLAAARDLVGSGVTPRVWLRAEDSVPWARVLESGETLSGLDARYRTDMGPLARVSVDVRP